MTEPLDPALLAALSDAALTAAHAGGASDAEVRVERIRSQYLALRDARPETAVDDTETGIGVRVHADGAIGFAAGVALTPDDAIALARQALHSASVVSASSSRRFELAPEPSHGHIDWTAPFDVDPTLVPPAEKIELLSEWSTRLLAAPGVDHVSASLFAVAEEKYLATSGGTTALQRRVRLHPQVSALALGDDGTFEEMRTIAPPVGRGWEYLLGPEAGWDWDAELAELPTLLVEKLASPSVEPGVRDLVIDPTNLWLTIHESVGHATELDRAMGYEAAYAGTSFATFDRLGHLTYGSPLMHVTGDRTARFGLATVALDDEGVAASTFDLVKDGTLVGYQLDRAIAAEAGFDRSNGCAFADSPLHIPIQRMANVSLQPTPHDDRTTADLIADVDDGLYVVGDRSWSIDMQRYNFQFTGQRFFQIRHGRLAGQVRDAAYQATTTDFWGALDGLGGSSTYRLCGAFNCGKGQPGQVAPVSHGCPSALFRRINVLNAKEESGR